MAKRCFVIQGFGKKQDYEQGKLFDLDASYAVIKEAIEEAGLECSRADELRRNALIEQVMYDQLLDADLIVADITTLNFNAAFELGVRYALRPHATLIVGEKGMNFPFDINHIYINTYEHLGTDLGHREAKRFKAELKQLVQKAVASTATDSPVYIYLKQLPEQGFLNIATQPRSPKEGSEETSTSLHDLIEKGKAAMREDRFTEAIEYWQEARKVSKKDDYIVQQLALATYKNKKPDAENALREGKKILEYLQPKGSFDAETLGLWAAVHKRLFEINQNADALEEAIFALERGFFIKRDYYNGINLAFMLDTKGKQSVPGIQAELHGVASYIRRKVKPICHAALIREDLNSGDQYWIIATLYEACVRLGQEEEACTRKNEIDKLKPPTWMIESTEEQVAKLRKILE